MILDQIVRSAGLHSFHIHTVFTHPGQDDDGRRPGGRFSFHKKTDSVTGAKAIIEEADIIFPVCDHLYTLIIGRYPVDFEIGSFYFS